MVLKVITTTHQEKADICGFNLSRVGECVYLLTFEYE